jgi:hypothetical protein
MAIGLGQFLSVVISASFLFPISSAAQFQFAGQRWVVDVDKDSHVTAVYDLSYPSFLTQISLGIISPDAFDYEKVKKKIETIAGSMNVQSVATFPKSKMKWNSIPWKKKKRDLIAAQGILTSFKLNDIDLDEAVTDRSKFRQHISEANERYRNLEIGKNSESVLDAFEFRKNTNGDFEIFWMPSPQNSYDLGRKIADLVSVKAGYYEMLELSALRTALGAATGLIPIPLVSALVGTAVDRFFYYYFQLYQSHQEMFLEMLATAEQDSHLSAFKRILNQEDRTQAASYIVLSNFTAFDFFKNIFFPKSAAERWRDKLSDYREYSNLSNEWLSGHQVEFKELGSRFAQGFENSKERYLYLSSRSAPRKIAGPYIGYDHFNPDTIVLRRFGEALLSLEVSFVANSMSFVGTGLQQIYKWTVESEIENSKFAESRLLATLEERQVELGEDWSTVLSTLPAQQANPMELSWDEQLKLLQARKRKLLENPGSLY